MRSAWPQRRLGPLVAGLAIVLLVLVGCGAASPSSAQTYAHPITIAMVDHGPPTDPFWVTLRQGAEQAAKDFNVRLDYQSSGAPGSPSESTLIQQALAKHPQGLATTIPDPSAEQGAIEQATHGGTPVVVFNAGIDEWQRLGALDYVGQNDLTAGIEAGQRVAAYGFRHVLCVIQEQNNAALQDRCDGIARSMQAVGGRVLDLTVPGTDTARSASLIEQALDQNPDIDSAVALGPPAYAAVHQALAGRKLPTVFAHPVATFDATAGILSAVNTGQALFAINQQPYLQGYLAVQILAQQIRNGLHPYQEVITGPLFVTNNDAANLAGYAARQQRMLDYQKNVVRVTLISHGAAGDPFWHQVEMGARQAAHDFGVKLTYVSPNAQGEPSQTVLINRTLKTNPDAISVTLSDQSAVNAVKHAVATHRPLLVFNAGESTYRSLGTPATGGALDFIGQDDLEAGTLAGQQLASDGSRNVLCVIHDRTLAGLRARCEGLAKSLKAVGGTVETLTVNGTSVSEMRKAINSALDHDPSIDTVMALGPPGFQGTMAALQTSHRLGKIKVASFDTSAEILKAVEDGQALFTINQQPYLEGYLAVEVLAQQVRLGVHPVGVVQTGPSLVTKQNAKHIGSG